MDRFQPEASSPFSQRQVKIYTFTEEQTKSAAFANCRSLINVFSLFLDHFPFVWLEQSCRQAWERLSLISV